MSYKPHTPNVPSGILYFGDPAGEAMLKAESSFVYDDGNDRLSVGKITTSSDVIVGGNLTIQGTTTTVNTEVVSIEDNILVLNSNFTGDSSGSNGTDAGIEIERGTSTNVQLLYDEGVNRWQFTNDGSTFFPIATGIDDFSGYIASVGAGAGLTDSGTATDPILDVNVDNQTLAITTDTVHVKDLGIDTAQLAADSVTSAKIADGAVTEAKRTRTITEVTADSTVAHDVTLVTTSTTNRTITLPTATNGKVVVIKKIDSGSGQVIIQGASHDSTTDRIDGSSSTTPRLYYVNESITCIAKNTGTSTQQQDWYVI